MAPVAVETPLMDAERWREARKLALASRHLLVKAKDGPQGFVPLVFRNYIPDPFHYALAARLELFEREVAEGKSPRVMIFAPPQHGKSLLVSRNLPAWLLGRHPDWRILLASYGAELAEEMSGDVRDIVRSEEYASVFGPQAVDDPRDGVEISKERKAVAAWRIAGHIGGMAAVGVGGAITGRPAEVEIIDDPTKGRLEADSETYRNNTWSWWPQARDRVQKGGGILVMATRWHHDDLPGRLLRLARDNPGADQWEVLSFKAVCEVGDDVRSTPGGAIDPLGRVPGDPLAPGRFDREQLETLRVTVGSREWSAKFQQRPTDDEGAIFQRAWWRFDRLDRANPRVKYQFWDLAFSRRQDADYSVCTTFGVEPGPTYRLLDVYRARLTFPEAAKAIVRLREQHTTWSPVGVRAVVIEKRGRDDETYRELRRATKMALQWYIPDRDKIQRAHAVTPLIEAGQVILPDSAPWLNDFLDEISRFPAGEHDDQVDSFCMGLICMAVRSIRVNGATVLRNFRVEA